MPRQDPGEPYYRVDSPEAAGMLAADSSGEIVVIDVRRDDEYKAGHVTGEYFRSSWFLFHPKSINQLFYQLGLFSSDQSGWRIARPISLRP